jgi:8-amino-7-oxononanoate synthase
LSRASIQVNPHTDVAALEHMLSHSDSPRKLVATDSVFSMDGNIAPLPELLALCERYDAWLLIDDAHGFGVLGEQGRGVLCHYHMASPRILYMGTLGKAAGIFGAFVAGDTTTIEWLMQRARTYVFSTAPPPMLSTGLMASLRLIETEDWRRARIRALAVQLGEGLKNLPWKLLASQTAIQPLIVGDNQAAVDLMEALKGKGIWVPAIRPPTVPVGTARLRISLSAAHTPSDVERLVAALQDIAGEFT